MFRLFPNLWGASLTVSEVQVDGQPAQVRLENEESALFVALPEPLLPGQSLVISLSYALALPEGGSGNYGILGLDDGVLALPHAYPLIPAYDDQGWYVELAPEYGDVLYADTSFYLMRVRAPEDWTLVASGVSLERTVSDRLAGRDLRGRPDARRLPDCQPGLQRGEQGGGRRPHP